ncbi:MAG TPA: GMC family oxidoreductase N-terminal domain-containing protein [Casimicrobiaceae bacterium]|nr:GMC family oxidoreductase N-terminal domain-containing protein [Casimicrobiaceae bacterium]
MDSSNRFDYIVVGAGSAGCVTASRLVRDHGARVLLLEAGRRDANPLFRMPAGFIRLLKGSPHVTFHRTIPQPQLGGRTLEIPQGHVLGGSSTVNGMVYMRGRPSDYDEWDRASGHAGWSYHDLLPHFVRLEGNQRLHDEWHGSDGPLKVSDHPSRCALTDAFVEAVQRLGVPFNPDFNGARQEGVGCMQLTAHAGRRCSAADAFLRPVIGDPRLVLRLGAAVTSLEFSGSRVTGVRFRDASGLATAHADREVIVTAGAFATPKLLMLSGVGPADALRRHGIDVRADLPGVGSNLQDHHEVPVMAATRGAYGYFGEDRGWRMVRNGLRYLLFRTGPVTSNGVEACAFVDPGNAGGGPSLQLYCVPTIYADRGNTTVEATHGVTLNACLLRPRARGSVRLATANPADPPLIDSGFLSDDDDMRVSIAGLRFSREVLASSPLDRMIARELSPGPGVVSDADLREHCKRTVKTNYHPVGTCRMGSADDPSAVVTPDLRVRGIEGLRIFDASMMPNVVSGNTNAVVMAVADRAVAVMMGESLPAAAMPARHLMSPVSPRLRDMSPAGGSAG